MLDDGQPDEGQKVDVDAVEITVRTVSRPKTLLKLLVLTPVIKGCLGHGRRR